MLRKFWIVAICLVPAATFAQKKTFTLKEAVTQQYRAFLPDNLPFFQWIPGTEEYTYLKDYVRLMKGSVKNPKATEWVTIEEVNKALGTQLAWFSGFEWKDQKTFLLNDGVSFYSYNVDTRTGKTEAKLDAAAENATLHTVSGKIAFTVENNLKVSADGKILDITSNADKNIVSGQTYARSEFGIHSGIFWSPKGNSLAFAQKDESEVHDYPLLDITQTPGELESIKYPMAGQKSEKPKIGIYHFGKGTTVFISPLGKSDDYLTNVAWTPDEKFLLIAEVNRDQNHIWLNKYDAVTGQFVKTLFEEQNDKWAEPEHPAFFPSETSSNFVWISERDGFNNLYYYDIEGKLLKQLTSNKFVVKDILIAVNKGTEVLFSATGESPLNTMYYAVNLSSGVQRLITKEPGTHTLVASKDGKWLFDEYSSHSVPGRSLLLDSKGTIKHVLLESPDKLAGYAIGTTEIGTIKASDGTTLYTRLIKPSNFDPGKKYPVLVYVYGGPHAQMITNSWLDGSSLWMHWMAEQGYLVFTLDNRGSAERGFAFESVIHRQLGTIEMEDQLAGVNYLKSLPYVDGNRLAVHGWSFGGFMTTSLMLRHAGVFQVGVAGGPVTDWKYYEVMYGERYMDRPEQNEDGYNKASLLNYTANLKGDLLLIHGTVDDVVVMQHNYALVKKFVDNGIQMDFFPYPMHKHNVIGKDRVHLMEKVLSYVLENNQ